MSSNQSIVRTAVWIMLSSSPLWTFNNALAQTCTGGQVQHASSLLNLNSNDKTKPENVVIDGREVTKPKHVIVNAPDVLLFDKADPPIFLTGWVAEIKADCVRVEGNVIVKSFSPGTQASSGSPGPSGGKGPPGANSPGCGVNGCKGGAGFNGVDGERGTPGYRPVSLRLTFGKVTWNGKLQIQNAGAQGGNGGAAGNGGPGGDGGKGRDRTCSDGPGDGGSPGDGGFGGRGGAGATGGAGGSISYNSGLSGAVQSGSLVLQAPGGDSGTPGTSGFGGKCGIRGDGGSGNGCGGGGTPGNVNDCANRSGLQASPGIKEVKGTDGLVYCYDCSK